MKKLFSALLISLIVFTLVTLPASATANDVKKDNISIQTTNSIEYKGLWYEENYYLIDWHSNAVTPDKNAKLNIWLENDNDVRLYVYKTNIWGRYSKIYDEVIPAGVTDIEVENDCNGKKYLVKVGTNVGAKVSIYVYQHG